MATVHIHMAHMSAIVIPPVSLQPLCEEDELMNVERVCGEGGVTSFNKGTTGKLTTRCAKCQLVLRAGVEYRGRVWHRECLTCSHSHCSARLAGTQFTTIQGNPYCFHCYGKLFAKKCAACTLPIYGLGDGFLVCMEGRHWHVGCFQCRTCETPLLGEITFNRPEGVMCQNCVANNV